MRPRAAFRDAEIRKELREGLGCHRRTAVGMYRQAHRIDAFTRDRPGKEFFGQGRALAGFQPPDNNVAAENVEHDVEIKIGPFLWSEQFGNIPGPNFPRRRGNKFWLYACWVRGLATPLTGFASSTQDAVPRGNRTQVDSLVEQRRVDLPRTQI